MRVEEKPHDCAQQNGGLVIPKLYLVFFLLTKFGIHLKIINCAEDKNIISRLYVQHIFSIYIYFFLCILQHPVQKAINVSPYTTLQSTISG